MAGQEQPPVPAGERREETVFTLRDIVESLRSRTWLSPVSADEMNRRDRWLADHIERAAALPAARPEPPAAEPDPRDQAIRNLQALLGHAYDNNRAAYDARDAALRELETLRAAVNAQEGPRDE